MKLSIVHVKLLKVQSNLQKSTQWDVTTANEVELTLTYYNKGVLVIKKLYL